MVIGAGIAGLGATLAFARAGHAVVLVERDAAPPPRTAEESFGEWDRPGVPQRRLVHGFLPLARKLLMDNLPDIVERLIATGAHHVDQLAPVPNREQRPGDQELFVLRSRRTVFEWVLRQAVAEEFGVTVRAGDAVAGLLGDSALVTGVRLRSGATIDAKLVVDAAGRRSNVATWLRELNAAAPEERAQPCGLVYFSRFYRHRDAATPVAFRAALGYATASATAADANTFSLTFFARAEEHGLRMLREESAFERAVDSIAGFKNWRQGATPLGPVNAMGSLDNSIRTFTREGRPLAAGLVSIGDTLSHTNPTLGRGMSLGLDHAFKVARIPWDEISAAEGALAYHGEVDPMVEASYADAIAVDDLARRLYAGDEAAREEPRAILMRALPLALAGDQDLFRANLRNLGLLEPPGWIVGEPWISRARDLLEKSPGASPGGPDLERMLAILEGRV